jgi:O-antigen/teichoic acid export membrane protein
MLLDRLKTLSKESIIYGLSGALSGVVSFLLLPLYAHALTPADYGHLSVLTVLQTVLEITIVFGLSSALFRYYLMADSENEKQEVLNTCIWTQFLFVAGIGILGLLLSAETSLFFFNNNDFATAVRLIVLTACISSLHTMVQGIIRAERKPFLYLMIQVFRILLSIVLNIYFVVFLEKGFMGVIYGNLLATGVSVIPVLFWLARKISFSFSRTIFFKIVRFSGPIYLSNLFFFVLNLSDRFFLNHFLTEDHVGIYSFGSKIGSIVMIGFITPFSLAAVPFVMSIARQKDFERTFVKIVNYFLIAVTSISMVIFFFSTEIVQVVASAQYAAAKSVVGPVLLASIFYGMYYVISITADIIEKTHYAMIVIAFGAVVGTVSNLTLIPHLGIYGALIANCAANFTILSLIYVLTQKACRINYDVSIFVKIPLLVSVNVCLFFLLEATIHSVALLIIAKVLTLAFFALSLFWINIFKSEEKEFLRTFVKNALPK